MTVLRPISRRAGRVLSIGVLAAWAVSMGFIATRAYVHARSMNLATDLARYGTSAEWRGVYYRGEKIGFSVSQMKPAGDGYELQEDARLQLALMGQTTAAAITTRADLDRDFMVRAFEFSLDPGTGPVNVSGRVTGAHVSLTIKTTTGTQTEERDLPDAPMLSLNLPRRLAAMGLKPGAEIKVLVFDPATLRNEPATITVGKREVVTVDSMIPVEVRGRRISRPISKSIPAFRLQVAFAGLQTTSWVTDTGEVVREESPLGLLSKRESPEEAQRIAVRGGQLANLIEAAAIVPSRSTPNRIDDPRDVRRIRIRTTGIDLKNFDVDGVGQSVDGNVIEIRDARTLKPEAQRVDVTAYLSPEPLIESNDPEVVKAAEAAVAGVTGARARAERLTRAVNGLLEKKPTVSLPSAREVLRTKVGDCNEHTALYVAMARALGIPSRIAVGLVYTRAGAFYYHAWPEVYLDDAPGRGLWLPVDPTFNEFPADATHLRLLRGGLDKQAAILPLIGQVKMDIIELEIAPNSAPVLVGRGSVNAASFTAALPVRTGLTCWSSPARTR